MGFVFSFLFFIFEYGFSMFTKKVGYSYKLFITLNFIFLSFVFNNSFAKSSLGESSCCKNYCQAYVCFACLSGKIFEQQDCSYEKNIQDDSQCSVKNYCQSGLYCQNCQDYKNYCCQEPVCGTCNGALKTVFDAAKAGDIDLVDEFLASGKAKVDAEDKDGQTLLYIATCNNNFDMVRLLVKMGADINKTFAGWTPLFNACYNNNSDMAKFLIQNGASNTINYVNFWGRTALYWACRNNNLQLARYLLENGASSSVNVITTFFGGTNLYWACYNGNFELMKLLIENGARETINNTDKLDGKTIIYWACLRGDLRMVKYLVENGANIDQESYQLALVSSKIGGYITSVCKSRGF